MTHFRPPGSRRAAAPLPILTESLCHREHRLRRGDIVKLVDHHVAPDGTDGYSIEVFNALGDTIAVTTVPAAALENLREDEILGARPLAQ